MENPFRPGMGRVPPTLAGRDAVLERYATWFRSKGSHGEIALIEGHRGVGKTSLLKVIGAAAMSEQWAHVHLEAKSDATFEELLAGIDLDRLVESSGGLFGRASRVKELSAELKAWGFGVALSGQRDEGADRPTPAIALARFAHRCDEAGNGLLLTVDEIQRASKSLCQSLGDLANRSQPIIHVWAGLPGTRTALQQREVTAAERARAFPLGSLNADEARQALLDPLLEQGIEVGDGVVDEVLTLTAGYPYFVQVFGDELWMAHAARGASGLIDAEIADAAIEAARETTNRFYEDRLAALTPRARQAVELLAAMDPLAAAADVAEGLGLSTKAFSPRRAELLDSGLVTSPSRGRLDLSFPGLRGYLKK